MRLKNIMSDISDFHNEPEHVCVSIIVAVYNPPIEYFNKFIESALKQTLKQIEILFIDDASPGEAPEILDQLAIRENRVKVFHRKENGRAGAARGDGLDHATGEYILFADCDDIFEPDMCETLYKLGKMNNADIVSSSWVIESADGSRLGEELFPDETFDLTTELGQVGGMRYLNHALWNKLFKQEMVGSLRFSQYAVNIGEDRLFNIECFCRSSKMLTTDYVGYHYLIHTSSATGRSSKGMKYLNVIRESESDVHSALRKTGLNKVMDVYADIWALQWFSIGCQWIADEPDDQVKRKMWSEWRKYYCKAILPGLRFHKMLGLWYRALISTGSSRIVWSGTWLISRSVYKFHLFINIRRLQYKDAGQS